MERIALQTLKSFAVGMARQMGKPTEALTRVDGKLMPTPGAFDIETGSKTYGRSWKLIEYANEAGGMRVVLSASTARELLELMRAYRDGYYEAQSMNGETNR